MCLLLQVRAGRGLEPRWSSLAASLVTHSPLCPSKQPAQGAWRAGREGSLFPGHLSAGTIGGGVERKPPERALICRPDSQPGLVSCMYLMSPARPASGGGVELKGKHCRSQSHGGVILYRVIPTSGRPERKKQTTGQGIRIQIENSNAMPLAANPSAPDASAVPCLLGQPQRVTRVHARMVGCFLALPVQTNQALKHTTHNDGGGHQGVKVRRGCPFTKPHATAAGAHAGSIASCHPRSPSLPSHKTCLIDTRWMLSWRGVTLRIILEMRRDLQLAFRENPSHCRDNGCTYYHVHVVLLWMRVPPARQAAASFIIRSVREADEAFSWRLHLFMLHLGCQFFVRALRETPLGLWRLWRFLWRLSEGREPDLAHGAQATRGKLGMWLNNSLSSVQSHLLQAGR